MTTDAATEQALAAAFAAMRAVGRREADRLTEDRVGAVARAAASVARESSQGHEDPVVAVPSVIEEAWFDELDGADLAPVSTPVVLSRRSRARVGWLATAAAALVVAVLMLRPAVDQVAVSSADQPGAPPGAATAEPSSLSPGSSSVSTPITSTPTTAAETAPSSTTSLSTSTDPATDATAGGVTADTAPTPGSADPPPPDSSTTVPPATPPPSATLPPSTGSGWGGTGRAVPSSETMTLAVGDAGTVIVGIVDNAPVLVDVAPADGWTPSVVQDHSSLLVQFATPGRAATLRIWSEADWFELVIDPGATDFGVYTRTRTIDLSPGGTATVVHAGGELRSIEAVAGPGWDLQSAIVGPDQLDLGFTAGGNWRPVGYVLTIGPLEIAIRAGG